MRGVGGRVLPVEKLVFLGDVGTFAELGGARGVIV